MNRIQAAISVMLFCLGTAFVVAACGGGGSDVPTATPSATVTPGTPFADLAKALLYFQTAGVPSAEAGSATFIGSVLNAGGIVLTSMESASPSEEDRENGVTSLAEGESEGVPFSVFVYETREQARDAATEMPEELFVLCNEFLIVFDGGAGSPVPLAVRVKPVMEARYGSCED